MDNRIKVNKLVGVTADGEFVFVDALHWNGVSCNYMVPMDSADIEERVTNTDPDDYKDCWIEAVKSGNTEDSLVDWFQQLVDECDGEFLGHDDSYVSDISKEDNELIAEYTGKDIQTYECIGGGTGVFKDFKFVKIFNQEVYETAIDHEQNIEAQQAESSAKDNVYAQ